MKKNLFIYPALAAMFILGGCGSSGSSSVPSSGSPPTFSQLDRLNRPAVNEVLATFSRHDVNNRDNPSDDAANLKTDIGNFMTTVAGRSAQTTAVAQAVLIPDVQIADLSGTSTDCIGTAPGTCNNYLGVETGGATQAPAGLKPFGGRALTDDIVDISLGAIFGNTFAALGLAPDDGNEQDGRADSSYPNYPGCPSSGCRPVLTSDGVSWQTAPKHFTTAFPYLGAPQ
ncbi:MAG: hypothetical protein NVS1B14_04850 [Vulcanimicrobiaceae bacterium]